MPRFLLIPLSECGCQYPRQIGNQQFFEWESEGDFFPHIEGQIYSRHPSGDAT